jgi:hypothetical protein
MSGQTSMLKLVQISIAFRLDFSVTVSSSVKRLGSEFRDRLGDEKGVDSQELLLSAMCFKNARCGKGIKLPPEEFRKRHKSPLRHHGDIFTFVNEDQLFTRTKSLVVETAIKPGQSPKLPIKCHTF